MATTAQKKEKQVLNFSVTKDGNHYLEFESPIGISQYGRNNYQGIRKSTMELTIFEHSNLKNGKGNIEWDVPSLEMTAQIGIWWENGKLRDYDGLSDEMPKEAFALLRKYGIRIPRDF